MQPETSGPAQSASRRLALITGASSGLGKALCALIADKGFSVLASGRNTSQLKEPFLSADLCDKSSRKQIVSWIHQNIPDLVINNAGFGLYGDALSLDIKDQLEMLEVNANAVLELTLEAANALVHAKKRGTIVNISSAAAFFVYPSFAVYAASKTFVNQISQALDIEFAPYGVRILSSCPGKIATDFQRRASHNPNFKREMFTMSVDKAAKLIWKQIEQGKREYIFDWRYRAAIALSRCIPKHFLHKMLRKEMQKRI